MQSEKKIISFVENGQEPVVNKAPVKRQKWENDREFFLVCLGYCVGLGNVWRFPYLCYKNGGGTFLIPYILVAIFVGMPGYFLEVAVGQFMKGSLNAYNLVPVMKGIGVGSILIALYVTVYYIMPMTWSLLYFIHSFAFGGDFAWSTCDNWWNTENCIVYDQLASTNYSFVDDGNKTDRVFAVAEFWNNYVTRQSSGVDDIGTISNYPLMLCFFASWTICYFCVFKGVKSTGKVAHFTATFPYVIITALVIRGCTLEGAGEGIKYFLLPNISKLGESSVWVDAGSQVVYSYGLGILVLTTFGSYNDFNLNCLRHCSLLTFMCSFTSFYVGFGIFGVLGHLAFLTGENVSDVATSGPGLAFPTVISLMPCSKIWGILFFFMLVVIVVDSEFTCIESVMGGIYDVWPKLNYHKLYKREYITLALFVAMALVGIPFTFGGGIYYFEIVNNYAVAGYALFPIVLFEMLTFSYLYGINRFCDDIKLMIGYQPNLFIKISIKFATPIVCGVLIVFTFTNYRPLTMGSYTYPMKVNVIGWMLAMSSFVMIPIVFIKTLATSPGSTLAEKWKHATKPRYPRHLLARGYGDTSKKSNS